MPLLGGIILEPSEGVKYLRAKCKFFLEMEYNKTFGRRWGLLLRNYAEYSALQLKESGELKQEHFGHDTILGGMGSSKERLFIAKFR